MTLLQLFMNIRPQQKMCSPVLDSNHRSPAYNANTTNLVIEPPYFPAFLVRDVANHLTRVKLNTLANGLPSGGPKGCFIPYKPPNVAVLGTKLFIPKSGFEPWTSG